MYFNYNANKHNLKILHFLIIQDTFALSAADMLIVITSLKYMISSYFSYFNNVYFSYIEMNTMYKGDFH